MAEEQKDNQQAAAPAQAPEGQPAADPQPLTQDVLATLQTQLTELKAQNAEAQKKISEVSTTNAALEQRLMEVGYQAQAQAQMMQQSAAQNVPPYPPEFEVALQKAADGEPQLAARMLNDVLLRRDMEERQRIAFMVEQQTRALRKEEQILTAKPHLAPLRPYIEQRAIQLAQQTGNLDKAIDMAVAEFERTTMAPQQQNSQTSPPSPPPASQGVTNQQAPRFVPKDAPIETESEHLRKRQEGFQKRFL
jgi:hypothetical protein